VVGSHEIEFGCVVDRLVLAAGFPNTCSFRNAMLRPGSHIGTGVKTDTPSFAMPLAFGVKQAEYPHMTPRSIKMNPTAGALRAASAIKHDASLLQSLPELIDHETGVREILELLQSIIAQAGDLIESRSPELVAAARAALARYHDDALGQAE